MVETRMGSPGSFPRVRGTARKPRRRPARQRFIPARAGNRLASNRSVAMTTVHPRTCGEQTPPGLGAERDYGSSPRVRGTARARRPMAPRNRFIPARAGNRAMLAGAYRYAAVHPRACGEQGTCAGRVRGGRGSSPRVRGTVACPTSWMYVRRFIPARAGNSRDHRRTGQDGPVHPRACGEQSAAALIAATMAGSSPRVRGTATSAARMGRFMGFIPARAGNSTGCRPSTILLPVHPRACGEQSAIGHRSRDQARFIPARAGNSGATSPGTPCHPVHPRACGEQGSAIIAGAASIGSSPRVRGTAGGPRRLRCGLRGSRQRLATG